MQNGKLWLHPDPHDAIISQNIWPFICHANVLQLGAGGTDEMAKDSLFQVRINSDIKHAVEELYSSMGTSFAEAVRIFAVQSLLAGGMPLQIKAPVKHGAKGALNEYADPEKQAREETAWADALVEKHTKID